jgi:hypothetical protein
MTSLNVNELREAINALDGDSKTRKQRDLTAAVKPLLNDFLAAAYRGVTWKSMAKTLSEKTGYKVTPEQLRSRIRRLARSCGKAVTEPALKPEPVPAAKKKVKEKEHTFIIAATSPEGELYQLEHAAKISGKPGGGYSVYKIDDAGNFHRCTPSDFARSPILSKETAINHFRIWAKNRGYEIYGGD